MNTNINHTNFGCRIVVGIQFFLIINSGIPTTHVINITFVVGMCITTVIADTLLFTFTPLCTVIVNVCERSPLVFSVAN